jgi:hypothetical protein
MSRQNPVFATRKASVYLEYKDPTRGAQADPQLRAERVLVP